MAKNRDKVEHYWNYCSKSRAGILQKGGWEGESFSTEQMVGIIKCSRRMSQKQH